MNAKKMFQLIVVAALLITSFASAGSALAWSRCPSYITVQWGDTLSGIAMQCGTTVDAIRAANPGLGWWLYAGQTLYIPTGGDGYPPPPPPPSKFTTYEVHWGDTIGKIAARTGVSVYDILSINPQIYNPSLIYAGQIIFLPPGVIVQPPKYPPHSDCPCPTPPPSTDSYSTVKIDYKNGMYLRSAPNGTILSSAVNKETVYYKPSSIFIDKKWRVWVEVKLYPPVKGYYTGWLMVRDQFGTYFTSPQIDP